MLLMKFLMDSIDALWACLYLFAMIGLLLSVVFALVLGLARACEWMYVVLWLEKPMASGLDCKK